MANVEIKMDPIIAKNMKVIMNRLHKIHGDDATILCGLNGKGDLGLDFYIYALDNWDPDNGVINGSSKMLARR